MRFPGWCSAPSVRRCEGVETDTDGPFGGGGAAAAFRLCLWFCHRAAVWAGNSAGTGNHTEIWAGVLNRSGAGDSAEELWDCSGGFAIRLDFPSTANLRELFPALAAADSREGYFIYGRLGEAATQWDLRGR